MEQTAITIPIEAGPIRHPMLGEIKGLPKPRYKGHWALVANDLDATDRFYRTLTGSVKVCRPQPTSVITSWDAEHHRFFISSLAGMRLFMKKLGKPVPTETVPPPGHRTGEIGGGIRFATPSALVNALHRMRTIGIEPDRAADKGSVASLAYHDPDGLEVEILAPIARGKSKPEETLDADSFVQRFG